MSEPKSTPVIVTLESTAKHALMSKTIWVQVAAVISVLFPPVRAWLTENPVEFLAALGAVNTLVRFVTKDRLKIFAEGANQDFRANGCAWICSMGLGVAAAGTLPSCSPASIAAFRAVPIRLSIEGTDAGMSYSSKGGLDVRATVRTKKKAIVAEK